MNDITTLPTTAEKIKEGEEYVEKLQQFFANGYLTDDERYNLTIQK